MIVFAITTGVAAAYLYEQLKAKSKNLVEMGAIHQPADYTDISAIVNTMVATQQLSASCRERTEQGQRPIYVQAVDLSGDGVPEYLVQGMPPCGVWGRMSMFWVYTKEGDGHRVLLKAGALDNLSLSEERTNGFKNLVSSVVLGTKRDRYWFLFKYDGHEYRQSH